MKRLYLILGLILFAVFLDHVGVSLICPILSSALYEPELSFFSAEASSLTQGFLLGLVLLVMPLTVFFSSPILGALSDRKGRRPLFLLCLGASVFGYACAVAGALYQSLSLLLFSRVLIGLADGSLGVMGAAIADLSPNERSKTARFGLYGVAASLGYFLSPSLGELLSLFGLAIPFLIAGLATLLNFFLVLFCLKETLPHPKKASLSWREGLRHLGQAYRKSNLRPLFVAATLLCLGWFLLAEFLSGIWIADYGLPTEQVDPFFSYGSLLFFLCSGIGIRLLVRRFSPRRVLFFSLCVLATLSLLLALPPRMLSSWILLPFINVCAAFIFPTYTTLMSEEAGADKQGEILGTCVSIQALTYVLGLFLGSSLVGIHPSLPLLLGGCSLSAATFLLGAFFRRQKRSLMNL